MHKTPPRWAKRWSPPTARRRRAVGPGGRRVHHRPQDHRAQRRHRRGRRAGAPARYRDLRSGGVGNTTSLFIRGAETRFTAVTSTACASTSQSTGGAGWEGIPLAQIDRIEVLRGPAAAVYGSDAVGGVIQLFTKRGEEGVLALRGHRLRQPRPAQDRRRRERQVGPVRLFASAWRTRKARASTCSPRASATRSKDGYTSPDRDGYNSTSGNVKLGFQITPDQRIEATLLTSDIKAATTPPLEQRPSRRSCSATTCRTTRCAPPA